MTELNMTYRRCMMWLLAFLLTAGSAVFQRLTGPTYPVNGSVTIGEQDVSYRFLRTETVGTPLEIAFSVPDTALSGFVEYRRLRSADDWQQVPMRRTDGRLSVSLPDQPPAGKLVYNVFVQRQGGDPVPVNDRPVVARYKGGVPSWVLLPHILIMFAAMLFSNRAGMEALTAAGNARRLMYAAVILLVIGGFVLGPVMQKYAFGAYWTGFPLGTDLTDNKTLLALLFWLWAWYKNHGGRNSRFWIVGAALVTLLIFMIPHSLLGSELDYTQQ